VALPVVPTVPRPATFAHPCCHSPGSCFRCAKEKTLGVPRKRQGAKVLHRTARVELRVTPAQRERCFGLLRSGADRWAAVLELNALRRRRGHAPIVTYQDLCRELARAGPGCAGALSSTGARFILRRYSDSWFCAAACRRGGDVRAHSPRRRRSLMPSRYYAGTFCLDGRRLTLPTARGVPPLALRLTRHPPYDESCVRSVTLVNVGPKLFVDVTAEVPVGSYEIGHLSASRAGGRCGSGRHPSFRTGQRGQRSVGLGPGHPGREPPAPGREVENPLTPRGWRSCTVEPAGIYPAAPGVTHDESRWITIAA
jgi:hypothetical protein